MEADPGLTGREKGCALNACLMTSQGQEQPSDSRVHYVSPRHHLAKCVRKGRTLPSLRLPDLDEFVV
eukprot:3872818-Rhodomonas_salina.1